MGNEGRNSAIRGVDVINDEAGCELLRTVESKLWADIRVMQYGQGRCGGLWDNGDVWIPSEGCGVWWSGVVAIHELLHALGFPHDELEDSIMRGDYMPRNAKILDEHRAVLEGWCDNVRFGWGLVDR